MKKFNLFKEIIAVKKSNLLQALNSAKAFCIEYDGNITFEQSAKPVIYKGRHTPKPSSVLLPTKSISIEEMLGGNYQIIEDEDRVLIRAFSNWQNIIHFNLEFASYDDTTGDGVSEFSYPDLEDLGWHATEFDITYRELVEELESRCEGVLLCIEQEEPSYRFSGLGFLSDNPHAMKVAFAYCQEKIKKLMAEDITYSAERFSEDERDAATYFELI